MSYFYKAGRSWRLTLYRDRQRVDINLGRDLGKARMLRSTIELATQEEKFKGQLVTTLKELQLIADGVGASAGNGGDVPWALAKGRILEYLQKIKRKETTIQLAQTALTSLEENFQPKSARDITPEKADAWIAALLNTASKREKNKTLSASTVSILVRSASSCFTRLTRWGVTLQNPFRQCDKPKVLATIPRPIEEEDIKTLLAAANPPLARAIRILVHSGMRPDEFFHLQWKNVQLNESPVIQIRGSQDWHPKAYMERIIPCDNELVIALGCPGQPEGYVCRKNERGHVLTPDWLIRSFKRLLKRTGLSHKKYTVYSCRDTYATNLAIQGLEAHAIAARMGHANLQTSMRYVNMARLLRDGR